MTKAQRIFEILFEVLAAIFSIILLGSAFFYGTVVQVWNILRRLTITLSHIHAGRLFNAGADAGWACDWRGHPGRHADHGVLPPRQEPMCVHACIGESH